MKVFDLQKGELKRVKIISWKDRGKVKGKLLALHARFSAKNCTDFSGLYPRCPNLIANVSTWTYPIMWIKCKKPRKECLEHSKIIRKR